MVKNNAQRALAILLPVSALVGTVCFILTLLFFAGEPRSHPSTVIAGVSADEKRAFWYAGTRLFGKLHIIDLDTLERSPILTLKGGTRQIEWSTTQNDILYHINFVGDRLSWLSADDRQWHKGPSAQYFCQVPGTTDELILVSRKGPFLAQNYRVGEELLGNPMPLIDREAGSLHRITAAGISRDASLLGATAQFDDRTIVMVRRRDDGNIVLADGSNTPGDGIPVKNFFFKPEDNRMILVRGKQTIDLFDTETGNLIRSANFNGRCSAAAAAPGLGKIALATKRRPGQWNHISLFETEPFRKVSAVRLPGEAFVLSLRIADDENSLLAIGRSGQLWRWDFESDQVTNLGQIARRDRDLRWIGVVVSLIAFAAIWFTMLRLRTRGSLHDEPPSRKKALFFLVLACILEIGLFLGAGLSGYSSLGFYILIGNLLLGVFVLILVASIGILKIPIRWAFVIPAMLVVVAGAILSLYVLSTITDI